MAKKTTPRSTTTRAAAAAPRPRRRAATEPTPTPEEIAEAAYQRYLSRGGEHGSDFDDWIEAERELRSRRSR